MKKVFEEKVYKYGDNYYSFQEIYSLCRKNNYNKKLVKDFVCSYILVEILKIAGFDDVSNALDSFVSYRLKHIESTMNKAKKIIFKKCLFLKGLKVLGSEAFKNSYKIGELMNGEWILNKLVVHTLGYNYPVNQINDFILVDYLSLSKKECVAIADNFMRNLCDNELVRYTFFKNDLVKKLH